MVAVIEVIVLVFAAFRGGGTAAGVRPPLRRALLAGLPAIAAGIAFGYLVDQRDRGHVTLQVFGAVVLAAVVTIQPLPAGRWTGCGSGSLAILPDEAVRTARGPRTTLRAFCQGAYEAGARLVGWTPPASSLPGAPSPRDANSATTTSSATCRPTFLLALVCGR